MNKIEVIKKGKEKYVSVKLSPAQTINTREAEQLRKGQVYQLINPDIGVKRKTELIYRVTNYMSLKEYLQAVTSKKGFLNMVLSVLDMVNESQRLMLSTKNFLISTNYIFVEPGTRTLMYVYLPIINYDVESDIKHFFQSLAFETVFNQLEDCGFVKEYIAYFGNHPNFSIYDFELFMRQMNGESVAPGDKQSDKEIEFKGADLKPQENIMMYAHPSKLLGGQQASVVGTTVLGAPEYGTTVLAPEELNRVIYPYIVRVSNGEKVSVNKKNFSIGQSASVDYMVSGNNAVSRNHAEIIIQNGDYFVLDKGSTNGTYIDDERLQVDTLTEIKPGQMLRFANESYEFNV